MLDGLRQRQPTQKVAQVIRQGEQFQPHLIGDETAAGEPRPFQGLLALLNADFPNSNDRCLRTEGIP